MEVSKEELEKLVDRKVEERLSEKEQKNKEGSSSKASRRSFIKMLGGGFAGLGAATILPTTSALEFDTNDFSVLDGSPGDQMNFSNGALKVPQIGTNENPVGKGFMDQTAVSNRDNRINVRNVQGENLEDRIETALSVLEGSGEIRIPRPRGGGEWTWTSILEIDTSNYRGITLNFDRGVEVKFTGNDWALKVMDSGGESQRQTFALMGYDAEVYCPRSSNPKGFVVAEDVSHFTCKINTRHFFNENGDGTAILMKNVDHFMEGWKLEGDHRNCDRGVDFAPSSFTEGSGTPSFLDGRAENLSVAGNEFGIRLRGVHKSCVFDNPQFFFGTDTSTGLVLDGNVAQTVFLGPRWDDTNGFDNETAIETGPNFKSFSGKPIFIGPYFANISNRTEKAEENHDLWSIVAEGSKIGFEDLGDESGLYAGRNGGFHMYKSGERKFAVGGNGNVQEGLNWQTGETPKFLDGIRVDKMDLSANDGQRDGQILMNDASQNSFPGGLYRWDKPNGNWVKIEDNQTTI